MIADSEPAQAQAFGQTLAMAPKNIVYIMLDDADYLDVGYNNRFLANGDALTPNIDALRDGGMEFTQFYAASAVCSPTRTSVLTGDNPVEFGALDAWPQVPNTNDQSVGMNGLPDQVPQIAKLLGDTGMVTGHFGKWHVGAARDEYRPAALGFDEFLYHYKHPTNTTNDWAGLYTIHSETGTHLETVDYLDRYFAQGVVDFIDDHAADPDGFFINFWPLTPHAPWAPPADFDNSETNFDLSTRRGETLAMNYTIDQEIGRVTDALKDAGVYEDTLIIVTSDNGGHKTAQTDEDYLSGYKRTVFEGGIRVPMVAHWVNGIDAGTMNDTVASTSDILPTFYDLMGGNPDPFYTDISGRSIAAALTDGVTLDHNSIVWALAGAATEFEDPANQRDYAYLEGDLKIAKANGNYYMYDLANDPSEASNLRNSQPDLLQEMILRMNQALQIESRLSIVPDEVTGAQVIPHDARIDVANRDMHLSFVLDVPASLAAEVVLYDKPGAQSVTLQTDGRLRWDLTGPAGDGVTPSSATLISDPLSAGSHSVGLFIRGYKFDFTAVELYIDGALADNLDRDAGERTIYALWSTTEDATLGADGFTLSDINYSTLSFEPEFWVAQINGATVSPAQIFTPTGTIAGDRIIGGTHAEMINGYGGNDFLFGGLGADTIDGGIGDDTLEAGAGPAGVWQQLSGKAGADTYRYARDNGAVVIHDQDGGQDGSASLNKILLRDLKASQVSFGVDPNTAPELFIDWDDGAISGRLRVIDPAEIAQIEFADGQILLMSDALSMATDVNDVVTDFTGTLGADQITGTEGRDNITALDGNDRVNGLAGDDVIDLGAGNDYSQGGAGADVQLGGAGSDWLQYSASPEGVNINLAADPETGQQAASGGHAEGDINSGFERVYGSAFDDTVLGDDGNNVALGQIGDDYISLGAGNDVSRGGAGADEQHGGAGFDWVQYMGSTEGVSVDLLADPLTGLQSASGGYAQGDILSGFERINASNHNDTLSGSEARDVFLARDGNDFVSGRGGNDYISLGAGNDISRGGAGADEQHGGDGIDWLQYVDADQGVTVDLTADALSGLQSASGGDADGDIISGFERVNATNFDDVLLGDEGSNRFVARKGDDMIYMRGGNDQALGGSGADIFAFARNDGNDVIYDFDQGIDSIAFLASENLSFEDLEITQSGAVAAVAYDGGQISVRGVDGVLGNADFQFDLVI